ncbi:MAG TPA: hypothetical protein VG603_12965, partial [Chitinophagales bacterium]|nr:hypothetical protein [Chitinophagales bacterium]
WQFTSYMFVFPLAIIAGLKFLPGPVKQLTSFALFVGGGFLLVISLSATKLSHYDAPLFPYLAIVTAAFYFLLYTVLSTWLSSKTGPLKGQAFAFTLTLILLALPYNIIISKVYFPKGDYWEEGFSVQCRYFQMAAHGQAQADSVKLVFDSKDDFAVKNVLTCYKEALHEKGLNLNIVKRDELNPGDKTIVFDGWTKQLLERDYETRQLAHIDKCNADVVYLECKK